MRCKNNCFICKLKILLSKWCVVKKKESRKWNVESYDYLCWELLLFEETTYHSTHNF